MKRFMKKAGDHTWRVTEPTEIEIGTPASPPSEEALDEIRTAISGSGATTVYWFWVSVDGDAPHFGLAVAPADGEIISRVGGALDPLWQKHSPDNPAFDILRLGDPQLDHLITKRGKLLYGRPILTTE